MKSVVTCGYLPLVDSAPLIIAKDLLFTAQEGLDLTLVKQPSWSAMRDRLAFGQIDFAHLLSPMPIAMSFGISGHAVQIDALMVLSMNGTVVGLSKKLADSMADQGWTNTFDNPVPTSSAILASGDVPLRIGVPFPFSMHRLLLEHWLKQDSGYSAQKIEIVSVPPPKMSQALREGQIDMFCVGEPWGTVAVQESDAVLALPTSAIWQFAPEKVLGARNDWATENRETCFAMIRAVFRAGQWLAQPENIPLAVEILASSTHLDLPDHAIEPALTGRLAPKAESDPINVDRFLVFHDGDANFPWRAQEQWIAQQLQVTGQSQSFRSDLYRAALSPIGVAMPRAWTDIQGRSLPSNDDMFTEGEAILGASGFAGGAVFDITTENTSKK